MRLKLRYILILTFFISGISSTCLSQDAGSFARSKNKVIISGKIYYIHLVQKSETIYSISKIYNIGQKDLLAENPDLAYGLKEGMSLKIPDRAIPKADYLLGDTSRFIYHVVADGETLYAIAQKYGAKVNEISELNPEVKYSNIQPRQVIKVPKTHQAAPGVEVKTESLPTTDYLVHLVSKGETLYSLARKFDIKKEDIIRSNGGDNWSGLKTGDSIRIPLSAKAMALKAQTPVSIPVPDSTVRSESRSDSCGCDSLLQIPHPSQVRVALILPLSIDDYLLETEDTAMSIDDAGQRFKTTTSALEDKDLIDQNWIEFFEGFMLALNHSKDSGSDVQLKVFDVGNILRPVYLQLPDLTAFNPGLIICPLIDNSYQALIDYAGSAGIPLVSPVYPSARLLLRDNIISFTPSWGNTMSKLTEWLANEPTTNLLVIHPADSIALESTAILRQGLPVNLVMKETVQNDTALAQIELALSKGAVNKVLILSDREEYVTEQVRQLMLLSRNYDINLVGFSSWSKFRSINIEDLHSLNLIYLAPFHTEFNSAQVSTFLKSFKANFNFYPYRSGSMGFNYAMLGSDICDISLSAIRDYNNFLPCCLAKRTYRLLLGPYHLSFSSNSPIVQKNNWTLVNYQRSLELIVQDY